MKQNTNTEAAETDQTTDSPAVVQQRLVLPPVLGACCSTKAFWFNVACSAAREPSLL